MYTTTCDIYIYISAKIKEGLAIVNRDCLKQVTTHYEGVKHASTAFLFATACEGWELGERLRKAITKVQKAARQKPNSKG